MDWWFVILISFQFSVHSDYIYFAFRHRILSIMTVVNKHFRTWPVPVSMGSVIAALCWNPDVPSMYLLLTILTMFNAWATLSRDDVHWQNSFAFFLTNLYCLVSKNVFNSYRFCVDFDGFELTDC